MKICASCRFPVPEDGATYCPKCGYKYPPLPEWVIVRTKVMDDVKKMRKENEVERNNEQFYRFLIFMGYLFYWRAIFNMGRRK